MTGVYVCGVCTCVATDVLYRLVCMWRPEASIRYFLYFFSTFDFKTMSMELSSLSWLAGKFRGCSRVCLPSSGIIGAHVPHPGFMWTLEIQMQTIMLAKQAFYLLNHIPSLYHWCLYWK